MLRECFGVPVLKSYTSAGVLRTLCRDFRILKSYTSAGVGRCAATSGSTGSAPTAICGRYRSPSPERPHAGRSNRLTWRPSRASGAGQGSAAPHQSSKSA